MDPHEAMFGPRPAASALAAVRDLETLAAYVGVCPTCLGWDDPRVPHDERRPSPGRAVCPTCGQCSEEWDLAVAIDAHVGDMAGLAALDAAIEAQAQA